MQNAKEITQPHAERLWFRCLRLNPSYRMKGFITPLVSQTQEKFQSALKSKQLSSLPWLALPPKSRN